jgi:DNA repair exonuclease SbcCD nuclease subunit
MTGFRFLHLADLHLETYFGGRPETRARLRRAALEAFEAAVDYAIERRLHAVLIAGDLYDDPLLSIRTELVLDRQIQRLGDAGIWFVAASGNHDPGGPSHRGAQLRLELDPNGQRRERVHVFRDRRAGAVTVTDPDGEGVGVVVGAGHATPTESANLAASFPRVAGGLPVVGLLHTHVSTARSAGEHDRYAPSGQSDFEADEFSYWALGHIHLRQRAVPGRPVYYAGNLQGRNSKETGEKGGLVVEARVGVPAEPRFVRFAPVRWERLRVADLPESPSAAALVARLAERVDALGSRSDELAVVIEIAGDTPLAPQLRVREQLEDLEREVAARTGAIEIQLRDGGVTRPVDRGALRETPSAVAHALEWIDRAAADTALLEALAPDELAAAPAAEQRVAYLRELLAELPDELIERSLRSPSP